MKTIAERFWVKVDKSGECWIWTACKNPAGYGMLSMSAHGKSTQLAPRVSWELHHGPIFGAAQVLHKCDTPACVKPAHLFLGTPADNATDKATKGRAHSTAGEKSGMAKLDDQEVAWIKRIAATGKLTQRRIAKMFKVDHTTIGKIIRGNNWKHIEAHS